MSDPFGYNGMPAWEQQLFAASMISSLQYQDQQRHNMALQAEYQYRQRYDFHEMGIPCTRCGGTKHALVADNRSITQRSFWTGKFKGWRIAQPFQGDEPEHLSMYCWKCGFHMFMYENKLTWEKELVQ